MTSPQKEESSPPKIAEIAFLESGIFRTVQLKITYGYIW